MFDANKFKARCSAIHSVMANSRSNPQLTEKQAIRLSELESKEVLTAKMTEEMADLLVKKENGNKICLSDTCIAYLMDEYAWATQGMVRVTKELMDVPQMGKGEIVEQDSLDLLCEVDGVVYKEHKDKDGNRPRIFNDFISGEIDAYIGNSAMEAETLPDVKSIWDYPTFLCKIHDGLTVANEWQLKGYGLITGAKNLFVANCLITTPERYRYDTYERLKFKLKKQLNPVTDETPEFVSALEESWEILEKSMIFDHIPAHQRVFKKTVEPASPIQEQMLYDRVKVCREWMNNFHEQYQKLNKL